MKERTRSRGDGRRNSKGIHGKEAEQDCRAKRNHCEAPGARDQCEAQGARDQ